MIGQIRGTILDKQAPQLTVDVHGIGYEIDAPMSTFYQLPDIGQDVRLYTHFVVREDAQQLYGFYTQNEKQLFRTLLRVNGVGPKLALAILSSAAPEEFVRCVLNNDTESLTKLPGIGKKTAERLVIEMRDKLSEWSSAFAQQSPNGASQQPERHQYLQDAIAALQSLGYKQQEASRAVTRIDDGKSPSEELIRRALKEMMA